MKRELMEPNEIDKIIRNKILENDDLHLHEMDTAKPFVWAAIQNEVRRKKPLAWYHLAAAVFLLLIGFAAILNTIQRGHKEELIRLSDKIDELEKAYLSQDEVIQQKNSQVDSMGAELKQVEFQLAQLQQVDLTPPRETFIFRTDTIYIKQVEYIASLPDINEFEKSYPADQTTDEPLASSTVQEEEIDAAIFPTYSNRGENKQAQTSDFKFRTFASRKN